jgi:amino acid adenylation domain-containing protein
MTDLQRRIAALSAEQRALLEARIAGLAAARGHSANERIRPRDRNGATPLSFAQQREWALERFRPANNITGAIRLEGHVDPDLISRILTEITARHEVLRTVVEMVDRMPVQVVHPVSPLPVPVVDLSTLTAEQQSLEVRQRYDAEVTRPFAPEAAQRMRVTLLKLAPGTYVALLTIHHASADGWSLSIIVRETAWLYQPLREGRDAALPPLPIQYGDFAVWQRARLDDEWMASEVQYWRGVLDGMPPRLALPTDRPHPVHRTFAGDNYTSALPMADTVALQRFAEVQGVSISMIMLAACSVLLYRYTGQDDLVFGSAITGRVRTETEQLIGCFANALPLRMRVSRDQTLMAVLQAARDVASAAFEHQDIPFDRLIEELAPEETSQTPLIQMMINVLTTPEDLPRLSGTVVELPGLRITPEPTDPGPVPIDLILVVEARAELVHFQWHYSTELFSAETIARLAGQLEHVMGQLVSNSECLVADVDLIGTGYGRVNSKAAAPSAEAPSGLVELLQQQVAIAPDAPAVICDGAVMTFRELNQNANRLARQLRALAVGPETPVGILLERSSQLAVAVLGVLKAGGAYLPIDATYPADRIGFMLSDASAPVLITTGELAPLAACASQSQTLLIENLDSALPADDLPGAPGQTSPCYVVYTSGSTGRPKGVVIEHRSLATFAREVARRLQLGAGDRFLQFASPSFDVLAEELFPVWLAGGAVVIPPVRMGGAALDLLELTEREHLTVMELPAAYWHEWVRELDRGERMLPSSLRLVIVGTDRVLPERLVTWQKRHVPLMHVYGITETTISSTFFRLPPDAPAADLQHLPIGTALPSVELQVLDSGLRRVPAGGVGELYIGGISLARGYLGRPGLTAERFVANPDPARPSERVYRTGDLVRQRTDGNMEFLSRADSQIRIRGFRVEPTEIESAMCRHPQIAQAVVTVHEPSPGDRRLVAYLVPQPRTRPNITDVRRFLAREIPAYLMPAAFVRLEAVPLTANGKIDHDRLPEPADERPELAEEFVAPQSALARQLAEIVGTVLGVTMVGANDNFFELGGDSILAIQVAARAQEAEIRITPLDLFEYPTVALLARTAADAENAASRDEDAAGATAAGAVDKDTAISAPTPADFPLANVDQAQLDTLLSRIAGDTRSG